MTANSALMESMLVSVRHAIDTFASAMGARPRFGRSRPDTPFTVTLEPNWGDFIGWPGIMVAHRDFPLRIWCLAYEPGDQTDPISMPAEWIAEVLHGEPGVDGTDRVDPDGTVWRRGYDGPLREIRRDTDWLPALKALINDIAVTFAALSVAFDRDPIKVDEANSTVL